MLSLETMMEYRAILTQRMADRGLNDWKKIAVLSTCAQDGHPDDVQAHLQARGKEIKDLSSALIEEVFEFLREVKGTKRWKPNFPHPETRAKQLEEHTDLLLFWLEIALYMEFTPEEMEGAFLDKVTKNLNRSDWSR